MNIKEFNSIKELEYAGYCDYLKNKYGFVSGAYMNEKGNKNRKISRTSEGLFVHHIYEDRAQKLADPVEAKNYPIEWQAAENLVYCNYLEHLFLHILIAESSIHNHTVDEPVGIGGILEYMVPELNDMYSGWQASMEWKRKCHDVIAEDKDVYLLLLKRFMQNKSISIFNQPFLLCRSANANYGWPNKNNEPIYEEIMKCKD